MGELYGKARPAGRGAKDDKEDPEKRLLSLIQLLTSDPHR
jgi:hypothetical protein